MGKAAIHLAPQIVVPKRDESWLACGNCRSKGLPFNDFRITAKMVRDERGNPRPKIGSLVVCQGCQKQYRIDDEGNIQAVGKIDPRALKHNTRHGFPF